MMIIIFNIIIIISFDVYIIYMYASLFSIVVSFLLSLSLLLLLLLLRCIVVFQL